MSDASSLMEVTPRQMRTLAVDAIQSGVVPFVRSSPGLGKSAIFRDISEEFKLSLTDHRLSTSAPEDLSGLPEFYTDEAGIRRARFVPFDVFPVAGTPLPKGKEGWLLFLDEMNHAPKEVQAASYKLILDKMVGQVPLHERVVICAAGNLDTDRAITNQLSTAMQSRVVHLRMRYDYKEWRDDVMLPQDWDIRIVTFLEQYPSKGMTFRPDHNDDTFGCPRTWEFMNKLIKGRKFRTVGDEFEMLKSIPLYSGTIGPGLATEFVNYCRIWGELPNIRDIIADPANIIVPRDPNLAWASIGLMTENVDKDNFSEIATYADRFGMNFRVLFYRITISRSPELRSHPVFAARMAELSRYLAS